MFEIIYDAVLEGIEAETAEQEFLEWVDAVDEEMENQDYWDFL